MTRVLNAEQRAPVSGEMSGHLFFVEGWYGTDDALHNAVRLLAAIGRSIQPRVKHREEGLIKRTGPVADGGLRPDAPGVAEQIVQRGIEAGRAQDRRDAQRVEPHLRRAKSRETHRKNTPTGR